MSISDRAAKPEISEEPQSPPKRGIVLFMSRHRRWFGWAILAITLVLLTTGPNFLSLYNLSLAFTLFDLMALALSWNLIGGYGGQFSLGHALFVGAGSYSFAVLLIHTGILWYLAIPLSGIIAVIIATLSGLLLLRLRDAYFAVGSLGLALAGLSWMINWSYTGQTQELSLPPAVSLDYPTLYYLSLGALVITAICLVLLVRSPFGLRLMAVRDDEDAAIELGVNSFMVKLTAYVVSAFFVGIVGALVALQNTSLDPNSAFSMTWTMNMIIMTILGGIATTTGPLIGAVVIFALQQQLQNYGSWSTLLTGILLIVMIRLAPEGIWAIIQRGIQKLATTTFLRQQALPQEATKKDG
jgi:branched-chain amino acid transport system permease protein